MVNDPELFEKWKKWYEKQQKIRDDQKKRNEELRELSELLREKELAGQLGIKLPSLDWRLQGKPPEMGRQRVDIFGTSKKTGYYVFVEIEKNRPTSIYNVVKAWQYVEDNRQAKPVLLIQVFSPYHFDTGDNKRRLNQTIFIGEQASKTNTKLTYRYLGKEYWPTDEGEGPIKIVDKIALLISDYEKNIKSM